MLEICERSAGHNDGTEDELSPVNKRMKNKVTSARIEVSGIELIGFHGYLDVERTKGNRFLIDISVEGDFRTALCGDRLEETIDYRQMVKVVRDVNRARDHILIESFADEIADTLLERFPRIKKAAVRVEKLAPLGLGRVRCAAIELEKERA